MARKEVPITEGQSELAGCTGITAGERFSFVPSLKQFVFLLGAFFLCHAISRGLISETLGLDDAEQVLLAQKWGWGYGPQPPLYTWLVMVFSAVFGWSSFTMALLKNLLLFGVYLLTYFNTRLLTRSHVAGVAAAVALEMMPSLAWEAHRELTHSILASLLVLATLLVFLNLKPNRWRAYLLLGICAGLGIISKYNFIIFFSGLLLAGICIPTFRPMVLNRRMALAVVIAVAIALPNVLWAAHHRDLAFASMYKLKIDSAHRWVAVGKGLKRWATNWLSHTGPLLGIFVILFWKPIGQGIRIIVPGNRLLLYMFFWVWGLILAGIVGFAVTDCNNRWLQPLVVPTPILLVALVYQHLSATRTKAILIISALAGLFALIGAPGRVVLTERLHKYEILNAPFRQLAAQLSQPLAQSDFVYAEDRWLAGNLRVWFPEKHITIPETVKLYTPATNSAVFWNAGRNPRAYIAGCVKRDLHQGVTGDTFYEATQKYHETNTMRVGLMFAQ